MAVPPRTDGDNSLRANLRSAQALLGQAGWTLRDGALRNAKGEALTVELLDSTEARSVTTMAAWQRALAKLGIDVADPRGGFRPLPGAARLHSTSR